MRRQPSTHLRRATIGAVVAVSAAAVPAVAAAVQPTATFQAGGVTIASFGSFDEWCEPTATEEQSQLCMTGDLDAEPLEPPLQTTFPLSGIVDFSAAPEQVDGALLDEQEVELPQPVTLTRVDADSWAVAVAGPYAAPVKLRLWADFVVTGEAQDGGGSWEGTLLLKPPAPVAKTPAADTPPAPAPSGESPQRAAIVLVGAVLRKRAVVARVRVNVAGELRARLSQGHATRRVRRRAGGPGVHRIVVPLPRPEDRTAPTLSIRLTAADGTTARVRRLVR
ncbi:hypothetical protein Q5424_12470 [Conexibacter sp. JD483]|uniref:hypothetical protein n=1 Tax=unclassified Conexibacter TaxID=2627773 RepID=UPI00271F583E|nr:MULTISPECIES: hypothetical protein [unclassified Conexibacter]MDO8185773.1 hypothetical protein [Conexibacter sp. CPCC 205706]MDO8199150.1 hypothetical protein [Conexibacter sp. CPCC 205762]MDR9369905.1 hypothetical protein [Conexibacter sp. JD483]